MEKCVKELKQEFKELQIFLFQLVAPFSTKYFLKALPKTVHP